MNKWLYDDPMFDEEDDDVVVHGDPIGRTLGDVIDDLCDVFDCERADLIDRLKGILELLEKLKDL